MNNAVFILMISVLKEFRSAQIIAHRPDVPSMNSTNEPVDTTLLNFYRQYSSLTDPGEYKYLYQNFLNHYRSFAV
jgi:hypothetical protein